MIGVSLRRRGAEHQPDALYALRLAAGEAERNGELERSLCTGCSAKKLAPDDPGILLGFGRVCSQDGSARGRGAGAGEGGESEAGRYRSTSTRWRPRRSGSTRDDEAQSLLEPLVEEHPETRSCSTATGRRPVHSGALAGGRRASQGEHPAATGAAGLGPLPGLVARDQGRRARRRSRCSRNCSRGIPTMPAPAKCSAMLLMSAQRQRTPRGACGRPSSLNPTSVKANYQLGLLLTRLGQEGRGRPTAGSRQDAAQGGRGISRLQLRLLDPDR